MVDSMYSALPPLVYVNTAADNVVKAVQDKYGMHMNHPNSLDGFAGGYGSSLPANPSPEDQGRPAQILPLHAIAMHLLQNQFRGDSPIPA